MECAFFRTRPEGRFTRQGHGLPGRATGLVYQVGPRGRFTGLGQEGRFTGLGRTGRFTGLGQGGRFTGLGRGGRFPG